MTIVPDCAFLANALIESQRTIPAVRALEALIDGPDILIAPYLLQIEFASALRRLVSRGIISTGARNVPWAEFLEIDIDYRWDIRWVERASEMAEEAGLSKVYDCLYLACAEANRAELITCDARFFRAVSPLHPGMIRLISP